MRNAMLSPLSLLYGLGWVAYESVYRFGWKTPAEPHPAVVCVGNLVVGGSGKTPFSLYTIGLLRAMGRLPVLSASGYGSPHSRGASLAPEGELDAGEWGDEAAYMRWLQPDLPLVVGRDRVAAAGIAAAAHPGSVLVLDDGFQHLRLRKHFSIVLDPPRPNRLWLPAGPYREPRSGLRRADLVLPSDALSLRVSGGVFRRPDGSEDPETPTPPARIDVLCAVAHPQRFFQALSAAGFEIVHYRLLPDHDRLDAGTLLHGFDPARPLFVTAKDWVKLRKRGDLAGRDVRIADYRIAVEPEDAFRRWLEERLESIEA